MITIDLTRNELSFLRQALDSHIYWQLSDEEYRDSGDVRDPGSSDPNMIEEIEEANRLDRKLHAAAEPYAERENSSSEEELQDILWLRWPGCAAGRDFGDTTAPLPEAERENSSSEEEK